MNIPFAEPIAPKYIYINPITNKIHLMVTIVGGQEISTDNTCATYKQLNEFFDFRAKEILSSYKDALEADINFLKALGMQNNPIFIAKEERLAQIYVYTSALKDMRYEYSGAITNFMRNDYNLYSIQLRPTVEDPASHPINPVFSINRRVDRMGTPSSNLYNSMLELYQDITIAKPNPQRVITLEVLQELGETFSIADIQRLLTTKFKEKFDLEVDFTKCTNGDEVTQEAIDAIMHLQDDEVLTAEEYIDTLIGLCTNNIWVTIPYPLFYSIPESIHKTEHLSILTQFFLAHVNIHCKIQGISAINFGLALEADKESCNALIARIVTALSNGMEVEPAIIDFINNSALFALNRPINEEDIKIIKKNFEQNYRTITATKENPHMDDFLILDVNATGNNAKFVTYQGSICVNFAEIVAPAIPNQNYFAGVREDFFNHPGVLPHRNECIQTEIDLELDFLVDHITMEIFERFPPECKTIIRANPKFKVLEIIHNIAQNQLDNIAGILENCDVQTIMTIPINFTDPKGRAFFGTAFEYSYWEKNVEACTILEAYMNDDTKLQINERINSQNQKPFDFNPFKEALCYYINNFDEWMINEDYSAILDAAIEAKKLFREFPIHMINELQSLSQGLDSFYFREPDFELPIISASYDLERIIFYEEEKNNELNKIKERLVPVETNLETFFDSALSL